MLGLCGGPCGLDSAKNPSDVNQLAQDGNQFRSLFLKPVARLQAELHHYAAGVRAELVMKLKRCRICAICLILLAIPMQAWSMNGIGHGPGGIGVVTADPGGVYASTQAGLVEESRIIRDAILARIRAALGQIGGTWVQGEAASVNLASGNGASSLHGNASGAILGTDFALFDSWQIGVAGGHWDGDAKFDAVGGKAKIGTDQLAVYGGRKTVWLDLRFGAAREWHSVDTVVAQAEGATSHDLMATTQVFAEIGHDFVVSDVDLQPFATLAWVRLDQDGFSNSAGTGTQSYLGRTTDIAFSDLGLLANWHPAGRDSSLTVNGTLGWEHALGAVTPHSVLLSYGAMVSTPGLSISRDAALIGAGLGVSLWPGWHLALRYDGVISPNLTDQIFSAFVSRRF